MEGIRNNFSLIVILKGKVSDLGEETARIIL